MRRNAYLFIIAIMITGILVSGAACTPLLKKKEVKEEPGAGELRQIRTGTEAIYMEFVKDIPPAQIYDSEELTVMVNIKNKGAENVEDAWFYIGGVDPNIVPFDVRGLSISDVSLEGYLPGKDELRGEEGESVLTFTALLRGLPQGTDVYEPNLIVTACYDYKTVASPIVCIDPNPFGVYTASKACKPESVSIASGQGGPIAVTKVEQVPSRGGVQFKIYVENKGKGKAIADEKYDTCNLIEPTDYRYVNKIDAYSVDAVGLNLIKCQPDPYNLRLVDEKGVIICSFDVPDNVPAYTTPLNIVLEYNYMESTPPKKIKIIHI